MEWETALTAVVSSIVSIAGSLGLRELIAAWWHSRNKIKESQKSVAEIILGMVDTRDAMVDKLVSGHLAMEERQRGDFKKVIDSISVREENRFERLVTSLEKKFDDLRLAFDSLRKAIEERK